MNALTQLPAPPAIVWPQPVINSVPRALDDACLLIERLRALFDSNTADFYDGFVEADKHLSDWARRRADSIGMIYTLAGEKLAEVERLIVAINEAVPYEPQTSIGRHVQRVRHRDWVEAVDAYKAAEAVPISDDSNDEDVCICDAAEAAFDRMVQVRAPDLKCLHEKMCIIQQAHSFTADGVIEALFADVEHLVRVHERNLQRDAKMEG